MIAIVPARGGSKGLPGKNIKLLNGKPLIAYTIEAALQSKYITDVIISTDDKAIYDVAIKHGAKETFLRPKHLAEDDSLAVDNYIYTLDRLKEEFNYNIDNFIVLQPTSPLRCAGDIDRAIELFKAKGADSVISYTQEYHPISWHKHINESGRFENIFPENMLNRQANRESYYPNGAIYIFRLDLIQKKQYYSDKSYAYLMPRARSVDIDDADDFDYVQYLIRKNQ